MVQPDRPGRMVGSTEYLTKPFNKDSLARRSWRNLYYNKHFRSYGYQENPDR